ncbi:MAG: PhoH family protein [Gammaproteobacteria bacterium]|nr:PhoH family protein [Gammaproteobacteria bacterium]
MDTTQFKQTISLTPEDNRRLAILCGELDEHIRQLEQFYGIEIHRRHHQFQILGSHDSVNAASQAIERLYQETANGVDLNPAHIHLLLREAATAPVNASETEAKQVQIRTKQGHIRGRGANQQHYLRNISSHTINFGIGPAGTGKTYLAVACAVDALEKGLVQRLILVRPAVEAGEKLGFLPGDLSQKVDPYLRPLYDALFEMMGLEKVTKLLERNIIEIAPLAYMRGRTLNDAFIILDESQNTTKEQMKMFLTRIGFGSTAVITGDLTQIDLPKHILSGLKHALQVLHEVVGISFTIFQSQDVVRHPLVQNIVEAYEAHEANENKKNDHS